MKINERCLPCLINQVIKVANITNVKEKEQLYKKVFQYLSTIDFKQTNPEIIGETFLMIKKQINHTDPYKDIRHYYNELFLQHYEEFNNDIMKHSHPFHKAIQYAIIGNIIDFSPIHQKETDLMKVFHEYSLKKDHFAIDHSQKLYEDIKNGHTLLYLGDNCGEICLDKLLLKQIKMINPNLQIYFGVRGANVVNDNIEEDAYFVGMNEYAQIISNGDYSLGTILQRTSQEFQNVYEQADIVIAKGQANYESLSEEKKNIYFMLMIKCAVISEYIGVEQGSMVCFNPTKELKYVW